VIRLLEQPNGDLISISFKGSLRRWLNSKEVLEQACKELSRHPALDAKNQGSKVEKAARTTCQRVNKPSSSQTEDWPKIGLLDKQDSAIIKFPFAIFNEEDL
jgi:hypothetical protein